MGKRVLVVEDSTMMRRIIVQELERAGHEVVGEAKSGQQAVDMYQQLTPDIVTMDITMRGMDGITASKEIFEFDKNAKILVLSNLDEEKYREKVDEIGAIGLINKHKIEQILELVGN